MNIDDILALARVIPILEIEDAAAAKPLAEALARGGLRVVETTLRTAAACDALRAMKQAEPDLIVGMGTVRSADDIVVSIDCGADFLVTPGAGPELLAALDKIITPALPGVATASEAMTAREAGFHAMKFFPAEPAGGIAYLKALAGPLPDIVFCPTGAISADRAPDYLALSNVACVGGSWIAPRNMIAKGDWEDIEKNARRAAGMKR